MRASPRMAVGVDEVNAVHAVGAVARVGADTARASADKQAGGAP
jgi:hypothetical protein